MIKKERITTRKEDFSKWYTNIVQNAELALYGAIKGTIIFQPNAWSIWESIQTNINKEFKKLNIKNVALPFLIPLNDLALEKKHVEGFAPELFTITKIGDKEISEPYIVRPTSEIPFCQYFKHVVSSYKTLPIKLNQWCSVMRAEKTTKPFLRNSEFHWQEMHSVHESKEHAFEFTKTLINLYESFLNDILCIPVIKGEKTIGERFAGAENTFTVEALMQDGQMLQCGTSHYLGQNFAKAYDIKFQNKENKFDFIHQVSAGISTRLLGAIIMVHGDDNGLVLPPLIAPTQIVINTIGVELNDNEVIKKINCLKEMFRNYRIEIDDTDKSLGYKLSQYEISGVPIQIVFGKKTISDNIVTIVRRDTMEKQDVNLDILSNVVDQLIVDIKNNIYNRAKKQLDESIVKIDNISELIDVVKNKKIGIAYWSGTEEDEKALKEKTGGITPRCIYKIDDKKGKCFYTNKETNQIVLFARAY